MKQESLEMVQVIVFFFILMKSEMKGLGAFNMHFLNAYFVYIPVFQRYWKLKKKIEGIS